MYARIAIAGAVLALGTAAPAIDLTILDPRTVPTTTTRETVNILAKAPGAKSATVGGVDAPVFATTSLLVRDGVPLQMGLNRIEVSVTGASGDKASTTVEITREAPAPDSYEPPAGGIDLLSIEPAGDLIVRPGDTVDTRFLGIPGKQASFRLPWGGWQPMVESKETTGLYVGTAVVGGGDDAATSGAISFRLAEADGKVVATVDGRGGAERRPAGWFRVARTGRGTVPLVYGLHEVRLAGPNAAELPEGTLVTVTGRVGTNYRVKLSPALDAYVSARDVELLPEGTPRPHLFFTSASLEGDDKGDTVTISRGEAVPFSVEPVAAPGGRAAVDITLYGAHHATTWFTHRQTTGGIVRMVDAQQIENDVVRVRAELHGPVLWGYDVVTTTGSLALRIRKVPESVLQGDGIKGLVIAVEPGHGGPSNNGARGVSGSLEKDINRMTGEATVKELEAAGAKVIVVRPGDEDVNLSERARRAVDGGADLFVSIHANSGGTTRGYLATGGTSHYYKWLHSRDLAEAIHNRVMEQTGLRNFGLIGNFNYTPIRLITEMPAILVEHAFMSNVSDEANMLDPEFRKKTAKGIRLGIEDFLGKVKDTAAR